MEIENAAPRESDYRGGATTPARRSEPKLYLALVAILLAMGLGYAAYRYAQHQRLPAPQTIPAPAMVQPKVPAAPDAAPKYPVPVASDAAPLPPLKDSDSYVQQALKRLFGAEMLARFFYSDDLVRRFVATV